MKIDPSPRVASYALRPGDTLGAAARKIVLKQAARVRKHAPGTLEGRDPEALHDLRVATRRLRFALRLFAPWMPPGRADRLRADLRRVALALGRVRDLDVFLQALPARMDRAGLADEQRTGISTALRRRRAVGRAALVRMLNGRRFKALVLVLERVPLAGAEGPARNEGDRMLRAALRKLRGWGRRADLSQAEDLHRLRILCKRLRYTAEYFRDLYGRAFDGAIARLIRLQDCLGAYQDAVAGAALLDDLLKNRDGPYSMRDAVGRLQAVLRQERGLQREAFAELWGEFPLLLRGMERLLRRCPPPTAAPGTPGARE
jgi:CHAD domain-containing protein